VGGVKETKRRDGSYMYSGPSFIWPSIIRLLGLNYSKSGTPVFLINNAHHMHMCVFGTQINASSFKKRCVVESL